MYKEDERMGCTERVPVEATVRAARSVWIRLGEGIAARLRKAAVMPGGRWLVAALILVVSTLLLAGCGGGGGEGGAGTPAAGGSPAASDITNELQALGNQWQQTVAKVSYDLAVMSGDTTDQSSLVLYRQPPDWRLDISSPSQGDEILIATGDTLYDCSADSGENQCLSYSASDVDISGLLGIFDPSVTATSVAGQEVDRSEQTISGESAKCFSVTSTSQGYTDNSQWCFASDGILLRLIATSDDPTVSNFTIEVTGVNRDVTEADFDFQPPYPVSTPTPAASPTPSEAPASPTPSGAEASPTPAQ
jgi:outer membrane lipoprotein-sorting protein